MKISLKLFLFLALAIFISGLVKAQKKTNEVSTNQQMPDWYLRGLPGSGHEALKPLVGIWRVHKSIYGTLGRSPDLPPIIAEDIITRREWVAESHYIEDLTQ